MHFGQRVEQIAYVVENVWEAAEQHSRLYGSGPFFAMDHVPVFDVTHRGISVSFDPSVALGQCGDVMIELLHDNGTGPSIIHDLYPHGSGRGGIHHICYHVENLAQSLRDFEAEGFPTVFTTTMAEGTQVAIVDTVQVLGHFVELYEKTPEIKALYDHVRGASEGFDGRDRVRSLASLFGPK